jgi:MFS family permease
LNDTAKTEATLPLRIVLLLALAMFINYVDRGNLATAGPLIKDELHLTNAAFGLLTSAFFWGYAPAQLIAGWISQRYDVRWVLAAGLAVWSIATSFTGLASGFLALFALRVLLGIGESVVFPCNCKMLAQRTPEHTRGAANGLITGGMALGPTFGILIGGLAMARFGWRAVFIAMGLVSLLWLIPWFLAPRHLTSTDRDEHAAVLPWKVLLRERSLWGASIGHFCSTYAYYFMLMWLPTYLVKAHGYSMAHMAKVGATVYCIHALSAWVVGSASDHWIRRGGEPNLVRKSVIVTGMAGAGLSMALAAVAGPAHIVAFLCAAGFFFGFQTPMVFSIGQTLGGKRAAAQWMGIQNFVGNLSGVISPWVAGITIDLTGSYGAAFAIAAAVSFFGVLAWGTIVRRVESIAWPAAQSP